MLGKGPWRVLRGHGTPACDSDFGLRALVHLTSFQQYLPRLFGDWSDVRFQEGERESLWLGYTLFIQGETE